MRGKGSASMKMTGKLRAVDGGTEVINISELNVVGILAQMGGRVITEVSNIMFEQFVNNFKKQLQSPDAAGTEATDCRSKTDQRRGRGFFRFEGCCYQTFRKRRSQARSNESPWRSRRQVNALSYTPSRQGCP